MKKVIIGLWMVLSSGVVMASDAYGPVDSVRSFSGGLLAPYALTFTVQGAVTSCVADRYYTYVPRDATDYQSTRQMLLDALVSGESVSVYGAGTCVAGAAAGVDGTEFVNLIDIHQ